MTDERIGAPWERSWAEIKCSLAVFSDSIDAAAVTTCVGIEPTIQRVKGEPRSPKRPDVVVVSNQWVWRPGEAVERSLDAQLDSIWAELGPRAEAFVSLSLEATVQLDVWIAHRGEDLSLGWSLDHRHVAMAASFGASVNVDEYDFTDS